MSVRTPPHWYPLREAAAILGLSPGALRKQLERHQRLAADGVVEARVDGVRGRKFANRWRVSLGEGWGTTAVLRSYRQASDGNGRGDPPS